MLLGREAQPGRTHQAAAHRQIPVVVVPPAPGHRARRKECVVHRLQPLTRRRPRLAPSGARDVKTPARTPHSPTPPRPQPVLHAAGEPRRGLDQVQTEDETAHPETHVPRHRRVVQSRASRTQRRLCKRKSCAHDGGRCEPQQRRPAEPQERQDGEQPDEDVPLWHQRQLQPGAGARFVQALKRRASPDPTVDLVTSRRQRPREAVTVHAALPRQVPHGIVSLWGHLRSSSASALP